MRSNRDILSISSSDARMQSPDTPDIGSDEATRNTSPQSKNANVSTLSPLAGSQYRGFASPNAILVNPCQKGNPVLDNIRNVPWEYGTIVPDYVMGRTTCALFLSLRYHRLHPDYIHYRLKQLGAAYTLRVLLVLVDVEDHQQSLKEVSTLSLSGKYTLVLSWSAEEAGRYLETYKAYEHKSADLIREKTEDTYLAKLTDCLTVIKSVNKTDVVTLVGNFGSLKRIMNATEEELSMCPGFGEQKARRVYQAFHEPFLTAQKDEKSSV